MPPSTNHGASAMRAYASMCVCVPARPTAFRAARATAPGSLSGNARERAGDLRDLVQRRGARRVGDVARVRPSVVVDALVRLPDVHEHRRHAPLQREPEERRDLGRLAVRVDDEQAPLHAVGVEVRADERDERVERRGAILVQLARRRLVDRRPTARTVRSKSAWSVVGMQVRERPVGHRDDPERHVAQRLLEAHRHPLRALQPRRLAGACRRPHREGRVEDDERLRVGALADELVADHDGLRGRDRDERGQRHDCSDDRDDGAAAGADDREQAPDSRRAALGQEQPAERQRGGEDEERVERRQEGDAEQPSISSRRRRS